MEQKNIIVAIVLSLAVLLGWQTLIEQPKREKQLAEQQRQEELAAQQSATVPDTPAAPGVDAGVPSTGPRDRDVVISETRRIPIATPDLRGSINLTGGRIDDLVLTNYRATTEPDAPVITLLSPSGSTDPYFAEFGWLTGDGTVTGGGDTRWESDSSELSPGNPVTLTATTEAGLTLTRTISVDRDYMFTISDRVENATGAPVNITPFGRVTRINEPETSGFFILHEGPIGILDGTLREIDYGDLEDETGEPQTIQSTGGWFGFADKYWLTALVPNQDEAITARFLHDTTRTGADLFQSDFTGETRTLAPGEALEDSSRLFAGAKVMETLEHYRDDLGVPRFEMAIDFGWFFFLTKPLLKVIIFFADYLGNFGLAILLVTIIIKAAFFPLANKSYRAMSQMKALQPKMTELREKYGDDKQRMQQELMALYKREKVNPVSGCLPILLQIPVFFALYKVLFISIEMRHAPFYGWVEDLSAPDPTNLFELFGLLPWDHPAWLAIGIWPLIMGVTMFLQQKLNPAPADPMQARIFMLMPVMFTVFLASFPVGLVIYWTWNNTLSIIQQWIIMKRMGVAIGGGRTPGAEAAGTGSGGGSSGGGGGKPANSNKKSSAKRKS